MTSRKRQRLELLDRDTATRLFEFLPNSAVVALNQSDTANSSVLNAVNVWQNRQLDLRFPNPANFVQNHLTLQPVTILVSYEFGFADVALEAYASLRRLIVFDQPRVEYSPDDLVHVNPAVTIEYVSPIHANYVQHVLLPRNRESSVNCVCFSQRESANQAEFLSQTNIGSQILGILLTAESANSYTNYEQLFPSLDTIQIGTVSQTFLGNDSTRHETNFFSRYPPRSIVDWLHIVRNLRRVRSLQIRVICADEDVLQNQNWFQHLTFLRHFEMQVFVRIDCELFVKCVNTTMIHLESASLILNDALTMADCVKLRFSRLPKFMLTVVIKHKLFSCRQRWPTVKHLHLRLHDQDSPSSDRDFMLSWLQHCVPNLETLVIEDYFFERYNPMRFSEDSSLEGLKQLRKLHFIGTSKDLLLVPSRVTYTFEPKPTRNFLDKTINTWKRDFFPRVQ